MGLLGKFTKAIIITLTLFLLAAPGAQAHYFDLSNGIDRWSVGSDDDRIHIDLVFILESIGGPTIVSYDYDLIFDTDELAFAGVSFYLPGFQAFTDPVVSDNRIRISAGGYREVEYADIFATLAFDMIAPVFDGVSDIELVSQIGTTGQHLRGMLLQDNSLLQYEGALGPDVGLSPVPVPGAVWLLASGLIGICGWRRKIPTRLNLMNGKGFER